jgi:hypothetical protein
MPSATHSTNDVGSGDSDDDTSVVARSLVALCRQGECGHDVSEQADALIDSLLRAHRGGGRFANRADCRCSTAAGLDEEASGQAIWAAGSAAACLVEPVQRQRARDLFESTCQFRSSSVRATAFAIVGAAQVLDHDPTSIGALKLLIDAASNLDRDDLGLEPQQVRLPDVAIVGQALILLGTTLGLEATGQRDSVSCVSW